MWAQQYCRGHEGSKSKSAIADSEFCMSQKLNLRVWRSCEDKILPVAVIVFMNFSLWWIWFTYRKRAQSEKLCEHAPVKQLLAPSSVEKVFRCSVRWLRNSMFLSCHCRPRGILCCHVSFTFNHFPVCGSVCVGYLLRYFYVCKEKQILEK